MKTLTKFILPSVAGLLALASPRVWALTETLTMDVLPETQGWELAAGIEAGSSTVHNGILTLESPEYRMYFAPGTWIATVNNAEGWTVEFRMRLVEFEPPNFVANVGLYIHDNTLLTVVCIDADRVCIEYPTSVSVPMVTTDVLHTYRIDGIGTSIRLFVDDALVIDYVHPQFGDGVPRNLAFGDMATLLSTVSEWDYFTYTTSGVTSTTPSTWGRIKGLYR